MKAYLLGLLLTLQACVPVYGATQTKIPGTYAPGLRVVKNYIKNPDCQTVYYVTSSSAPPNLTTHTTSPLLTEAGTQCRWNPGSAATLKFDIDTLSPNIINGNCEASFYTSSTTTGEYVAWLEYDSVQVTADLALDTSVTGQKFTINYPCAAAATTRKLVIESTTTPSLVYIGGVSFGEATNVGSVAQASYYGGIEMAAGASGCLFSENSSSGLTTFVDLGTGSGCNAWTAAGSITAQATNDHRAVATNMPHGEYQIVLAGNWDTGASGQCIFRLSDGTSTFQPQVLEHNSQGGMSVLMFHVSYSSAGSRTFKIQAADNHADACRWIATSAGEGASWKFYRFPTGSQQAVRLNQTPAYYTGYHDNTCSWARTNTAYGDFTADAGCALVQRTASNMACTATGSVLPAVACTFPKAGVYHVCASLQVYGGATANRGLRLWDGTTTIVEGGTVVTTVDSMSLCGIYTLAGLSATFTIQGKAATNSINIDNIGPTSTIEWKIWPLGQNEPTPLLIGSVSSNTTGLERIERAKVTCDGGSAVVSQSGAWISAVGNIGGGTCAITVASGIFSGAPSCSYIRTSCSAGAGVDCFFSNNSAPTATSLNPKCYSDAGSACTSFTVDMLCMGPR